MRSKRGAKRPNTSNDAIKSLTRATLCDIEWLKKLSSSIHLVGPGAAASQLEHTLLRLVNPFDQSCSLCESPHPHFSRDTLFDEKINLAARCFTQLAIMMTTSWKQDRLCLLQERILLGLCDSFIALLDMREFSSMDLLRVREFLVTKTKTWSSLKPLSKDKMPLAEYIELLLSRIDFFTLVIRHLLDSGQGRDLQLHLPLMSSTFMAILGLEITDLKRTSNEIIQRSTRLLHCLSHVSLVCRSALAPGFTSLITTLYYQLKWTGSSLRNKKYVICHIRHRLAALSCLKQILTSNFNFSISRIRHLLHNLLEESISDITILSNLEPGDDEKLKTTSGETDSAKLGVDSKHLLTGNLLFLESIFRMPRFQCFRLPLPAKGSFNFDESESLDNSMDGLVSRVQLCLSNVMQRIIARESAAVSRTALESHSMVLTALGRVAYSLLDISNSSSFRYLFLVFLDKLRLHPDPHISSYASATFWHLSHSSLNNVSPYMSDPKTVNFQSISTGLVECPIVKPSSISSSMSGEVSDPYTANFTSQLNSKPAPMSHQLPTDNHLPLHQSTYRQPDIVSSGFCIPDAPDLMNASKRNRPNPDAISPQIQCDHELTSDYEAQALEKHPRLDAENSSKRRRTSEPDTECEIVSQPNDDAALQLNNDDSSVASLSTRMASFVPKFI